MSPVDWSTAIDSFVFRLEAKLAFATGWFGGACPGLTRLESIVATNSGVSPGLTM